MPRQELPVLAGFFVSNLVPGSQRTLRKSVRRMSVSLERLPVSVRDEAGICASGFGYKQTSFRMKRIGALRIPSALYPNSECKYSFH